jgi:hypothetical protein
MVLTVFMFYQRNLDRNLSVQNNTERGPLVSVLEYVLVLTEILSRHDSTT